MDPVKVQLRQLIHQIDAADGDEQKVMTIQMVMMHVAQIAQSPGHEGLQAAMAPVDKGMLDAFMSLLPKLRAALFEYEAKIP